MSKLSVNTIAHTGGTAAMSIASTGIITPTKGVNATAFRVQSTDTDQSAPSSASTKIEWETVSLDTGNYWDSSNHRYKPLVAGWYLFGGTLRMALAGTNSLVNIQYKKNGTEVIRAQLQVDADAFTNGSYMAPTSMVQMNGSSDYLEMFLEVDETAVVHDNAGIPSEFWGWLVHAT